MKKKTVYDLAIDDAPQNIYININEDCQGNVGTVKEIGKEKAKKLLGCNESMIATLEMIHYDIDEVVALARKDLVSLYEKIERLEEKVGK